MKPQVKNAADEQQVKSAVLKNKLGREREIDDIRFLLSTEQGRRFYWRYLSVCGIYQQSADNSGSWTYFKEGQRSIGLILMNDLMEADTEAYVKMIKESKKEF